MIRIPTRSLVAVVAALGFMLALAPAAAADPVSDAVAHLRVAGLYVDPAATANGAKIDQAAVVGVLPANVKIAVLPDSAGPAITLARDIGNELGASPSNGLTIGVLSVTSDGHGGFRAESSRYCPGFADAQARGAVGRHTADLQNGLKLTSTIADFVQRLRGGPVDNGHCSTSTASTSTPDKHSGSGTVWLWIAGIAGVGALGMGALVIARRRRRNRDLQLARARVMPYYDELANDINTLDPKDVDRARQALADASERFTSAGSQLATADSVEKYDIVRRTVLEGLYATRTARVGLGMDPGPPLPPIEQSLHEQLSAPQQVTVQGQQFQGYPGYTPGSPYYFGGGWGVPGGWYGTPFWETMLLGSVLGAGLYSGGMFGGGYGYGMGYDEGYEAGQEADGGGSNGSGDFGGGGGDFGGGGGDFGGGGDSGGSW